MWGTFTNADRTVHLSEKAVDPPGQARPDFDIFMDYARRMDFRDKDGDPFPQWTDPESAFEAWKTASAGRPCDYSGLSYEKLRSVSGIQWPCNADNPDGTERLYADGKFFAQPDYCESYGRDMITGAPLEPTEYQAMNPDGKAMIKAAEYLPAHEPATDEFPFMLITGRTIYHFHTRTKTARAPQLNNAAPRMWVEISAMDAKLLGIAEGDLTEVRTPRGKVLARARVCGIREHVLFLPFHYGYWDADQDGHRAANELTPTEWDPASKQPLFKTSAAAISMVKAGDGPSLAPTTTASAPVATEVPDTEGDATARVTEQQAGARQ